MALDVWSDDPVRAVRAVARARSLPEIDVAMLATGDVPYGALWLAQPVLLPQFAGLVADCLGWSITDVESVARGGGVINGAIVGTNDIRAYDLEQVGPAVLVPLLRAARTPAADALRARDVHPEALVTDVLPVPTTAEAPRVFLDGLWVPSRVHAAYHHLAILHGLVRFHVDKDAPAIIQSYDASLVEYRVRQIAREVRGEPASWEPVDLQHGIETLRERLQPRDGDSPESIEWARQTVAALSTSQFTTPATPNSKSYPYPRPTTPMDACFVDGGCIVAFGAVLVDIELPSGRVRAIVPSGKLRIDATSADGRFVRCFASGGEWWPRVAYYSVVEKRWLDHAPPGFPSTILASVYKAPLEVFDLERIASRPVGSEGNDADVTTSPDGRFAWRCLPLAMDRRGVIEVATDLTVWCPRAFEQLPPDEDDDEMLDGARALVKLAGAGFRVFAEGRLRHGDAEVFRADNVEVAAFSRDGSRLALVHRHALRILDLDADGAPQRELRVNLLGLRSLLTLDRFWGTTTWDYAEAAIMNHVHSVLEMQACPDGAALLDMFNFSSPTLECCERLRAVAQLVPPELPTLDVVEHEPTTDPPKPWLLGRLALREIESRWIAPVGVTACELALRYIDVGATLVDRDAPYSAEGTPYTPSGITEWVLRTDAGTINIVEDIDLGVTIVVGQPTDLELLGDETEVTDDDPLMRQVLVDIESVDLDAYLDTAAEGEVEALYDLVWIIELWGGADQRSRLAEIIASEQFDYHRSSLERALLTARTIRNVGC